jgi:hypothetical protein
VVEAEHGFVFRVEVEDQLAPGLAELYCLYGTSMIGVAKKESVDFLSVIMQRKVRERSGEEVTADNEDDDDEASASTHPAIPPIP